MKYGLGEAPGLNLDGIESSDGLSFLSHEIRKLQAFNLFLILRKYPHSLKPKNALSGSIPSPRTKTLFILKVLGEFPPSVLQSSDAEGKS